MNGFSACWGVSDKRLFTVLLPSLIPYGGGRVSVHAPALSELVNRKLGVQKSM
jgi:hypothetical protein